ncbi:hypothetical protein C5S39_04350 [Candidatus Methanophagaceae archaeon]|jgi:hypothetical protein|nr:hypothetical protein C5S39_04350 [Methanophagales archaeon]
MRIEKAGKSAVIRIKVPKLSIADPFENQREEVAVGIQKGKQLLTWPQQHAAVR